MSRKNVISLTKIRKRKRLEQDFWMPPVADPNQSYLKSETFPGFGRLQSAHEKNIIHLLAEGEKAKKPNRMSREEKLNEAWKFYRMLMIELAPVIEKYYRARGWIQ